MTLGTGGWTPVLLALFVVAACSGSSFDSGGDEPCQGSSCGSGAGGSGADAGSGVGASAGTPEGGANPTGGAGGSTAGVGASPTMGGAPPSQGGNAGEPGAGGGETGAGGSDPLGFPATSLLDDFERLGPAAGENWIGASDAYSLSEGTITCQDCTGAALWVAPFGADQEVYAALTAFDLAAHEINLILRAQSDAYCDQVEVLYSPLELHVNVAYCTEYNWVPLEPTSMVLAAGDQLGARVHADGTLEIFVNGVVKVTYDVSAFPYTSGRIGLNGLTTNATLAWDDFGGGNLP